MHQNSITHAVYQAFSMSEKQNSIHFTLLKIVTTVYKLSCMRDSLHAS